MEKFNLFTLWNHAIDEYTTNRQLGTAHVYLSAFKSFAIYNKGVELSFHSITPLLLREYELHLLSRGLTWNTIATYMKSVRAIYNRGVAQGLAPFVPNLFKAVCTSPRDARKRALEAEPMASLIKPSVTELPAVQSTERTDDLKARLLFSLLFLLRGMPFVDVVNLREADLRGDKLIYHRRKTGRSICVWLTEEAKRIIHTLRKMDSPRCGYLLPYLSQPAGSVEAYREYQCALRRFNRQLKRLAGDRKELAGLSSYCARHTWATTAYHLKLQTGIISEALGHSSISITENYLKSFRDEALHEANCRVIDYVLGSLRGGKGRKRQKKH